jgi:GlpG protein
MPKITLTITLILICSIIHIGYTLDTSPDSFEKDEHWGYYSAESLWDGAYWGYLTSAFIHYDQLHIIFNMYWLFILGDALEKRIGGIRMGLMVIAAAIVTSGFEFLVTEDTGLGFSGVLYCFFGFMWMTKSKYRSFEYVLTPHVIQVLGGWLFVCIILTQLEILNVGNAAHFSGAAFGIALGKAAMSQKYQSVWLTATTCMLAIAIVPLFWLPWSIDWLCYKADVAYEKEDYDKEIQWLTKAIKLDDEYAWAYYSRGWTYRELEKHELADADFEKAYKLNPSLFEEDE